MSKPFICAVLLFSAGLSLAAGEKSGKLYRWTDANGKVHYTDKLPPESAPRDREKLNDQGLVLQRQQRALTAEERKAAKAAKAAQDRIAREAQKAAAHDRFLLSSYSDEAALLAERQSQLGILDGRLNVAKDQFAAAQRDLAAVYAQANGQTPSGETLAQLRAYERNVAAKLKAQQAAEAERQALVARWDADLARYRALKAPARP